MKGASSNVSVLRRICASDAFTTFVVCTAIFSDTFIYDLIIPFIPQMLEHRLGIPRHQEQQWVSTLLGVFGGAFAIGNVLAGLLTNYSRSKKSPFLLGMCTMLASSLAFFLGRRIEVIITARALQGVSASFVWVSGLAFLNSRLRTENIAQAMGYVSLATALGELLGPVTGGAMYEHAGHNAVLGLVCGILGVDIVLRLMLQDNEKENEPTFKPSQNDEERPLLEDDTSSTSVSDGTTEAEATQSTAHSHLQLLGYSIDRDLCASFYAVCIIGTVRYGFESALVVFVSQHFGWSPTAGGGVLFAFICPAILGPVVGHFTGKYGPRWISIILFSSASVAVIVIGFLTESDLPTKIGFVVAVAALGVCVSSLFTVQSIAFSVAAKRKEVEAKRLDDGRDQSTGTLFGAFSLAQTVGMFTGPAAAEGFIDHVNWMSFNLFLAGLCAVSVLVMSVTFSEWDELEEQ